MVLDVILSKLAYMIRHNQFGLACVYVSASMLKADSDDGQCGNVRGSSLSETAHVIINLSVSLGLVESRVSTLREGVTFVDTLDHPSISALSDLGSLASPLGLVGLVLLVFFVDTLAEGPQILGNGDQSSEVSSTDSGNGKAHRGTTLEDGANFLGIETWKILLEFLKLLQSVLSSLLGILLQTSHLTLDLRDGSIDLRFGLRLGFLRRCICSKVRVSEELTMMVSLGMEAGLSYVSLSDCDGGDASDDAGCDESDSHCTFLEAVFFNYNFRQPVAFKCLDDQK